MFNNNDCNKGAPESLVMMQEPQSPGDTLKKIWEYECLLDDYGIIGTKPKSGGGNVIELPDGSMLASMGYCTGIVFIVSIDKKITWSAIPENWNSDDKEWKMYSSYRASIILNKEQLEHLIWGK